MQIFLCRLTLHENLFFATREIGRLYETRDYLHNYALTYALGLVTTPYFQRDQVPRYAEQLSELNEHGIYVTPARGVHVHYALSTFKYADNHYHVQMEPGRLNVPSFGRAKEIAVGSQFEFFVIAREQMPKSFPRWIRLGKWSSKAIVESQEYATIKEGVGEFIAACPLNPLDVSASPIVYDLISMPPVSLIHNAKINGTYYELDSGRIKIPTGMKYTFPKMDEPKRSKRKQK
ncbi:MAG: type I-D CRISPR-associated protein Cas5/Csc1 [Chloroflexi bacterium]|nr:type I-D CRISPR-associated protein Cas5/Csc1 [Chloroflexota bacterium]